MTDEEFDDMAVEIDTTSSPDNLWEASQKLLTEARRTREKCKAADALVPAALHLANAVRDRLAHDDIRNLDGELTDVDNALARLTLVTE